MAESRGPIIWRPSVSGSIGYAVRSSIGWKFFAAKGRLPRLPKAPASASPPNPADQVPRGPPHHQQELGMTAAEEYRHIAEEFFRGADNAKTEEETRRFFNMALFWSHAAARENGTHWVGTCALKQ